MVSDGDEKGRALYRLAEALAEYVHCGQIDKQGAPYIDHVKRVAAECGRLDMSLEHRCVAVMHDVIEDWKNPDAYEALLEVFGPEIAEMVADLTRRYREPYDVYISRLATTAMDVVPIKLADLADNLDESRGPIDPALRGRYLTAQAHLTRHSVQGIKENSGENIE